MRNAIPTIYACGPMNSLSVSEAEMWRLELADRLFPDIMVLSPTRDKFSMAKPDQIIRDGYNSEPLHTDKGIVTRDKNDVKVCDLLFANLSQGETVSIGSMIEFGWANMLGLPIVLYIDGKNKKQLSMYDHPFIRELACFISYEFDEAIDIVKSILLE